MYCAFAVHKEKEQKASVPLPQSIFVSLEVFLSTLRVDGLVRDKLRVKKGKEHAQDPTGISEISTTSCE